MLLYQRTDCPFCWKVRIALAELDIAYDTVDTRLGEKHPDLLRLSPAGTVPVLVDGDTVIWESAVILDYLDRRYAPASLISTDPAEEARVRLLHAYSDKIVGGCLKDLVFEKRSRPEPEWDRAVIDSAAEKWQTCLSSLENQLDDRTFFGGTDFSAGDCALAARFGVAQAYDAAVTEDYPNLYRWYQAVASRPSWQAAYPTSFIRTE